MIKASITRLSNNLGKFSLINLQELIKNN